MKKALLILMVSVSVFAQQSNNDAGESGASTFSGFVNLEQVGSVSFTGSEATMSPRFFRSGTPGDACSTFSSGNFQYQTVPFLTDDSGSLTVSFDPAACGTGIFVTFHTAFDPTNICSGYVWSFGSSAAFTETFAVPASSSLVMVVSGVANAPGVACGPASYELIGVGSPASVPVLSPAGLLVFAGLLGLLAMGYMVRKKAVAA